MSNSPVFVIGLDAADKDLIEAWSGEGLLPNFRRLQDTALWGDVQNPRGLEAGSVWPAFYYGVSPAESSQFDGAHHFDPQSYKSRVQYRPSADRRDPIWASLSKAGKLCAVIDAPYHYPIDDINGIKIADRGAHVPCGGGDFMNFRTHPEELAEEIIERFGPDPINGHSSDFLLTETADQARTFTDLYAGRVDNKTDLALHYWRQRPWDFFLCVFTEAHIIGHRCWHIHDPEHPDHDPALAAAVGDPVKEIYVAVDRAVGRLINGIGDDARILVYLSHGMGPMHTGVWLLDRILASLDNQTVTTQSGPVLSQVRAAWRRMPDAIRRPLKPLRDTLSHDSFQPNRAGRRFFEVYANFRTSGIRINLAGREARGIVQPGEEYEAVCDELVAALSELENADTGELLVREVLRTSEHHHGEYIDHLPDLLVTWNRSQPIRAARSSKIGTIDNAGLFCRRTGDHRTVGRFFGISPSWPHRRLNAMVKAEDFAPTVAKLLAVQLERTDGKAISALTAR